MTAVGRCPQPHKDQLTQKQAKDRAWYLNRKVPNTVHPYRCEAGHWHVGNPRTRSRRRSKPKGAW